MDKLSYLIVLLSLVTSNIESYTLTTSVLNQLGYNNQRTSIEIYDNGIDKIDTNALNGYDKLDVFILGSDTFLTIDIEVFKAAVNLTRLSLYVPSLNKFTNTKNIILPKLKQLIFSTNLTSLNKPMFNAFPSLNSFVSYIGSGIKTIDVHTFESLSNLIFLDLSFNSLTSFEYLQIPKNLSAINLAGNSMNYFALSRTMGVLNTLKIDNNRFRSFKSMDFTFLANLTYLELSNNPHAYPYEIAGHLKPLSKLTHVELANLNITSIDSSYFKYNTKLQYIELSRNKINSLDNRAFNGLNDLDTIRLGYNNLTRIGSGTFSNPYLNRVDLSGNQISHLDESAFRGSFYSTDVILVDNNLTKILPRTFISKFTTINLSNNKITEIENLTFEGLSTIVNLYLFNNRIEKIESDAFNNLIIMDSISFNNNSLTELRNKTFAGQNQLKSIDLGYNKLSTIEPGAFANLPNLKYVGLYNNQLTQLDSSMFAGSNNLVSIALEGNPNLSTANLQSLCPSAATNCHVSY